MMTSHVDDVLRWLDSTPSIARTGSAANKLLQLPASDLPGVRLAILRNVYLEPLVPHLVIDCFRAGLRPEIYLAPYDNVEQDVLNSSSALYSGRPDIIFLALRLHGLAPSLVFRYSEMTLAEVTAAVDDVVDRITRLLGAVRQHSSAIVVVHNLELCPWSTNGILDGGSRRGQQNVIRALNARLVEVVERVENAFLLDFEHLMARVGYESAIDDRYWHIARSPYSPGLQKVLAAEYVKYVRALKGKSKKCLVLDCDNTLWGGVIGEDGVGGIALGASHPGSAFQEFQAAILDLYRRGVLLAVCSKNNETDVLEVLSHHPGCLLKPHHFVCKKINWKDKVSNIREVAGELNLGLDSLVFVDDNPFECTLVREQLPDVTVVQLPADTARYRRTLQDLGVFDSLALNDEDLRRSAMYLAEAERRSLQTSAASLEDYLRSLQMELTIREADSLSTPRIAQLTQKTNQFNLTTRRYSESEITQLASSRDFGVYYAQLRDRFDDSGIIAVAILRREASKAHIDTLLMSCRVIGRGVESALLAHIAARATELGASELVGEYLPTAKNSLVANLFPEHGFAQGAGHDWRLKLPASLNTPSWFREAHSITTQK